MADLTRSEFPDIRLLNLELGPCDSLDTKLSGSHKPGWSSSSV